MTITTEQIVEAQRKEAAFAATEIGKAFLRFKSATIRASTMDTEDAFTERDRKSTADAHAAAATAETELRALLKAPP